VQREGSDNSEDEETAAKKQKMSNGDAGHVEEEAVEAEEDGGENLA
jgi:hypothetical protein